MDFERDPQNHDDAGLARTAERLSAARVDADAVTLDRALATARARVAPRRPAGGFLRSRIAIVAVLTTGLAFSGTGATFALQGSSGAHNASEAQYPPPLATPGDQSGQPTLVPGPSTPNDQTDPSSGPGGQTTDTIDPGSGDQGDTKPGGTSGGGNPSGTSGGDPVRATRQVAATGSAGDLPFTGFAAIPLIAIGFAMLLAGLLMQRARRRPFLAER
jgi:hypothetical protein